MQDPDIIVIGAGAAGIFAAWRAATLGSKVLLLEKTSRIGTKILISGGGKCNVAHDGDLEDVLKAFRPNEARFIRPACYRLTNAEIIEFFTFRGLEVYTRPDGRVFPVHQTARDVVAILTRCLEEAGVQIQLDSAVTSLLIGDSAIQGVFANGTEIDSPRVILSTGGSSYPATGTTGDAWPWLKEAGHTIVKVRAALAPVYMEIEGTDPRAGISLRDITLKARQNGKEIARWTGDMLFTHRGLSGPTVLGITRVVAERFAEGPVDIEVDILPKHSFEAVREQVNSFISHHPKRTILSFVEALMPKRLAQDVLGCAGIRESVIANQLSAKERNRLIECLKGWHLGQVRIVPLEKGEVVAGGVALSEVNSQTMESTKIKGLFLCGEVLDIAGPVGGYNLQSAFATGYLAGEAASNYQAFS